VWGLVVFFFLSAAAVSLSPRATEQPLVFNHRKHVVDNEMECSDCHEFYETEAFSGMPDAETCSFCHLDELQGESAEEGRLAALLAEGESLDWGRLFRQPPHVFYSHRRHAAVAQIECEVCHGSIGQSETPPKRVERLIMDDCLTCHEEEGASTECTSCHR
jgi:hypothetical protein